MDIEHADHTQMTIECKRLGSKMNKSMDLRISRVIQEGITCRHKDPTFTQGKGKKYKSGFNTDFLVRRKPVRNDHYYTHLFSLKGLHTGYTTARYVNMEKYESKYEMLNKVATEYICTVSMMMVSVNPERFFHTQRNRRSSLS